MKTERNLIDINTVSLMLWIATGVAAFAFDAFFIAFYCYCAVLVLNIIYYLYEYQVKYKGQRECQLKSLLQLRTQLCYATILAALLYVFSYCWLNYKYPLEDAYIIVLGILLIVSLFSLIVCICVTGKTKDKLKCETDAIKEHMIN